MIQNDDTISRQAAINKLNERQRKLIYCFGFENDAVKIMDIAKSIIIAMPPAQPERKTGKWILIDNHDGWPDWKCSQCVGSGRGDYHYCPWCNADMRGEQNER